METRKFSREFKLEAIKLVRERGVSFAQAARDLDVNVNILRRWAKEFGSDPARVLGPPDLVPMLFIRLVLGVTLAPRRGFVGGLKRLLNPLLADL